MSVSPTPSPTPSPSCFWPDGLDRNEVWGEDNNSTQAPYQPISSGQNVSMCCASWNTPATLPAGLCQDDQGLLWRESCTDSTWKSEQCLHVCVDGDYAHADVPVTRCADGSFCCDADQSCCSAGLGFTIAGADARPIASTASTSGFQQTTTSPVPSSTIIASDTLSSTGNISSTSQTIPPPRQSQPVNGISIAGLVVGVVALVTVICLSCVLTLHMARVKKSVQQAIMRGDDPHSANDKSSEREVTATVNSSP